MYHNYIIYLLNTIYNIVFYFKEVHQPYQTSIIRYILFKTYEKILDFHRRIPKGASLYAADGRCIQSLQYCSSHPYDPSNTPAYRTGQKRGRSNKPHGKGLHGRQCYWLAWCDRDDLNGWCAKTRYYNQ